MSEESSNLIERARLSKQHKLGLLALEVLLQASQHLEVIVEFEGEEVLGFLLGKAQIEAIDDSEAHSLNELVRVYLLVLLGPVVRHKWLSFFKRL